MRILMLAPTPFFAHRGCHVRILEEIRALSSLGAEVALCTYGLGEDVPGVRTVRSPRVPWYRKLTAGPSWHKLYLDALLLVTAALATLRFRPHVLHAHLHEGVAVTMLVAWLFRVPLVADLQGSMTAELCEHGFFDRWRWGERLFSRLERWIDLAPAAIVTSTETLLAGIAATRPDGAARVTLLGDGVDAEVFRSDDDARRRVRERLGYRDGDLVVAYLGLLTAYQGIDLLLDVAPRVVAQVPAARFLIMGFPNEAAYRERAEQAGLGERVRFTGRIRYEEAAGYLSAADVAVSPKLSTSEANGKLLDYIAVGLPTVAFDTPVNRAILGDLGVYARLGDEDDLAARLVELLRYDGARRRALGGALRRRAVEQFSWRARGRQLEAIYERVLGGRAGSAERARASR